MAPGLLVVLGAGLVAAASGLSMALGAFIAGLLLAETEYRREIEATIDPFKGLLLGLFFVSVGMALDVTQLAAQPRHDPRRRRRPDRRQGRRHRRARRRLPASPARSRSRAALLLGPGGEFAFVILAGAVVAGLVPEPIGQFGLVVATVSMIAIPGLARIVAEPSPAARIAPRRGPGRAAAGAREGPRDPRRIRPRRPDGRRDAGAP